MSEFFGGCLKFSGGLKFSEGDLKFWGVSEIFGGSEIFKGGAPLEYCQHSAGTHPTGMHSCPIIYLYKKTHAEDDNILITF